MKKIITFLTFAILITPSFGADHPNCANATAPDGADCGTGCYFDTDSFGTCENCALNSFCPDINTQTLCNDATDGIVDSSFGGLHTLAAEGSTSINDCYRENLTCSAGNYYDGTDCAPCFGLSDTSVYCPGTTIATDYYGTENDVFPQGLSTCPSGYIPNAARTNCELAPITTCPITTYYNPGTNSCEPCPANNYCPGFNGGIPGNNGLEECDPGEFSNPGSDDESDCKYTSATTFCDAYGCFTLP